MIINLFGVSLMLVLVQGENPQPGDISNLDDLILTLFPEGNTTILTLPPGVPEENDCPIGRCVPYSQCNTDGTDGTGVIDVRFDKTNPRQCRDYLETCCEADLIEDLVEPEPPIGPPRCGQSNLLGVSIRISGDDNLSQYGEFPWMAAILQKQSLNDDATQNVYQCGGSLIHPSVVLTGAHCVAEKPASTIIARLGEWDTQTQNEQFPHQDRTAMDIMIHPEYVKGPLFNDIALIILNTPVDLGKSIQTICLPPHNTVFDFSRCSASGWGKNQFGQEGAYQVVLKKIEVPIVPRETCQTQLRSTRLTRRFKLHKSFICAGGERGKDTCRGDGGSPLVCPVLGAQNRFYQSGIVAWGIGCGTLEVPGVYVNVAQFRNWIDSLFTQWNLDKSFYTYN